MLCCIFLHSADCYAKRTIEIVTPSDNNISVTLDNSSLFGSYTSNQFEFKVALKPQLLEKKVWEKRTLGLSNNGSEKARVALYLFGLEETIILHFPEHKRINSQILLDIVGEYKQIIETQKADWDEMQETLAHDKLALGERMEQQGTITETQVKA